jgi:hypothetical protein
MALNIIELIDKSPITRLSKDYEHKFIEKIKKNFTESEQNIFLSSFYMYLNYDQDKEFVIDFEFVWKYLEFTRKDTAKKLLVKHFKKDIDYIENLAPPQTEINNQTINKVKKHGGNKKFGNWAIFVCMHLRLHYVRYWCV